MNFSFATLSPIYTGYLVKSIRQKGLAKYCANWTDSNVRNTNNKTGGPCPWKNMFIYDFNLSEVSKSTTQSKLTWFGRFFKKRLCNFKSHHKRFFNEKSLGLDK